MNANEIIQTESQVIVPTYVRPSMVFTHGMGAYLFDADGKRYLDFAAGIAVNALGHSDNEWAQAVADQAARLVHVSNLYYTAPQVELAQLLVENSFADRVYYANTGAEANEAALKFARKWGKRQGNDEKTDVVAFTGSFHGRTVGALAITSKAKYREPFEPLMPGVTFAEFNNLESARKAITPNTCAVFVEPVQGEGGIHPAVPGFLEGLRELCDANDALLIFDEVQCGLGRTGNLWAHQAYGAKPDMMTVAKPLAGGLPIGVTMVTEAVARIMQPGDHGSTFAGGPLVCRAGQVVFNRVNQPEFLNTIRENGAYLLERLETLPSNKITDVRGFGLMVGVEFSSAVKPMIGAAAERGLLIINAGENVLRLCPPLIVSQEQIDQAVQIIGDCLCVL